MALVAIVLGSAYEVQLMSSSPKDAPFDVQSLLGNTYFGTLLKGKVRPSATGIASYGLSNDSGTFHAYNASTSEVVGQANISSLSAAPNWNYSVFPARTPYACGECASLQMNVWVLVRTKVAPQSFWIQDVVKFFDTSQYEAGAGGEIFNLTSAGADVSSGASGSGRLQPGNQTTYAWGSDGRFTGYYSLPLDITFRTSVAVPENQSGVEISLSTFAPSANAGVILTDNGGVDFNGSVYLPIRNVTSASIVVSPYLTEPPLYWNYDAELVWGGFCCAQTAKFSAMNSTLSLRYVDSQGLVVSFPSFYTFGASTGESSANLNVSQVPGGGDVTVGSTDNRYLKSA